MGKRHGANRHMILFLVICDANVCLTISHVYLITCTSPSSFTPAARTLSSTPICDTLLAPACLRGLPGRVIPR